jgi:hypothetical protein
LELEEKNYNSYLNNTTITKILTTFDNEILINHKEYLLEHNTGSSFLVKFLKLLFFALF